LIINVQEDKDNHNFLGSVDGDLTDAVGKELFYKDYVYALTD